EIGFGTGSGLLTIARMVGESGLVHGIDISGGMLQVAQRKVREAGFVDRVILEQADARDLPYERGEFDAVFLSFTLELFDTSDIPVVLQHCRRVLREHGRLGVVSLSSDQKLGLVGRLYQWLHTKFPRYLDCRPIPVEQTLLDAGFEPILTEARSLWGLPVMIAVAQTRERH
ncbi:MAG: class I SAM-dependent methyltransferase, partial [Anaerolineae bacterium]|nr:class I SAM-dependent methyltransferase [Anaerolineae bacterium]